MVQSKHFSLQERTVGMATLMIVTTALVIGGVAWPLWARGRQLTEEAAAFEEKLEHLRALAGRQTLIAQADQAHVGFRSDQPPELIQREFFDDLERWTHAGDLQMNLKPRSIDRGNHATRIGVELELEGAQSALLAFLDRLFSHPSLIDVERLKISPSGVKERPLQVMLTLSKVVLRPAPLF